MPLPPIMEAEGKGERADVVLEVGVGAGGAGPCADLIPFPARVFRVTLTLR